MKVHVAHRAGFCWGVRRGIDAALEAQARHGDHGIVQTLGPLIHNPQALNHLAGRGIQETATVGSVADGTVIIRTHGIPKTDHETLAARQARGRLRVINGTCPAVAKVQACIRRQAARGGFTLILGQASHAEVVAHCSYATSGWAVVASMEEARVLPDSCLDGALVVAQTTYSLADFQTITQYLGTRSAQLTVLDTICADTYQRQREAMSLISEMDAVVVVGGHASNNTKHLVEVADRAGKPVQWVECAQNLDLKALQDVQDVGVLAGASTPNWTVAEVVQALQQLDGCSWWRSVRWGMQRLQVPFALALGGLTAMLHAMLGWSTGWAGPLLPASFHVSLCALLPYLDPFGLNRKGRSMGCLLDRHRRAMVGAGSIAGAVALAAAVRQGSACTVGMLVLTAAATSYQRMGQKAQCHRIGKVPAILDLSLAFAPATLAILLPDLRQSASPARIAAAFLTVFCLALAFHSLRHLHAIREDQLLGREILSVAIGSTATRWLAATLVVIGIVSLTFVG